MTDWHDNLDDRSRDGEKARRLVNVLAKLPGEREAKVKFLEANMPRIEGNAALRLQQQGLDPDDSKAMARSVVSVALGYWKNHLLQWRKEHPQERGPRGPGLENVIDIISREKK